MSCTDSALTLLHLGDENRETPFLNKIWYPLMGTIFGIGGGVVVNFATRRPAFSGIQKHILGVAVFSGLFTFIGKKRSEYFMERDAILREYVRLHPEDFVEPERKKIGELFEPWIPIR